MADPSKPRIKPDPRVNPWRDDLAAEHLRGEIDAPVYARGHDRAVIAPVTALRRAPAHGAMMDTQLLLGEKFRVYEERGPGFGVRPKVMIMSAMCWPKIWGRYCNHASRHGLAQFHLYRSGY